VVGAALHAWIGAVGVVAERSFVLEERRGSTSYAMPKRIHLPMTMRLSAAYAGVASLA
jgi:hypothetical protein